MRITQILESASMGGTSSGSVATAPSKAGKMIKRQGNLLAAEADELRARGGIEAVNKKPRAGQTDYRNIPAGNYPGSQRKFSDKDRAEQPGRLKAAIKSTLGKHTKPNLPKQGVAEGSGANKTHLAMAYLKAVVMAPMGTPDKRRILNWQEELEDEFDIEMDTAALAQMLPQFDSMLQAGKLDKLQNRMASRGELYIESIQQGVAEGERTMSRAAKGNEKYGKDGMKALAKAGRDGASEKKLDTIRDKHDNYNEDSDPCWKDYKQIGMKKKGGKSVPNCVPKESIKEGGVKEILMDLRTMSDEEFQTAYKMSKMQARSKLKEKPVEENKKGVRAVTKPRNFVAKNAAATTSGAGSHKDKKKAMKQGDSKHKGKELAYESKLWAALDRRIIK